MARSPKDFLEELMSWPENGGFQYERLFEVLSEFEARLETLETLHQGPDVNCPLETGIRPCLCDLPRCPKCNYTEHDARFEMDHHLCGGEIPKE